MKSGNIDRRNFLSKSISACAVTCIGVCNISALSAMGMDTQIENHKFDSIYDRKLTQTQVIIKEYCNFIELIKVLQKNMNNKEVIELLKKYSYEVGARFGKNQSKNSPDNSFESFVRNFRPPAYKNRLSLKVVTDTPKEFELKVTECIWATVFIELGLAGEIGHAAICNMDYSWPQAYNPDIRMERNKTLMQGDLYCNHKYIDTKKKL